jgi:hypothetical protein
MTIKSNDIIFYGAIDFSEVAKSYVNSGGNKISLIANHTNRREYANNSNNKQFYKRKPSKRPAIRNVIDYHAAIINGIFSR